MDICPRCKGWNWVCCETHPDQPWDEWHQENCGPGGPCPDCNGDDKTLKELTGSKLLFDRRGWIN